METLQKYSVKVKRTTVFEIPLAGEPDDPVKMKNIAVRLISDSGDWVNEYKITETVEVLEVKE